MDTSKHGIYHELLEVFLTHADVESAFATPGPGAFVDAVVRGAYSRDSADDSRFAIADILLTDSQALSAGAADSQRTEQVLRRPAFPLLAGTGVELLMAFKSP
ncbi:hypothetical protein [Arthrobacter sp. KNU40]|uniref:hypothetical protein n=1 Tax=Arthrobacter sp. KNU40 TaxID=3447965 RepID=UPI003F5FC978